MRCLANCPKSRQVREIRGQHGVFSYIDLRQAFKKRMRNAIGRSPRKQFIARNSGNLQSNAECLLLKGQIFAGLWCKASKGFSPALGKSRQSRANTGIKTGKRVDNCSKSYWRQKAALV